MESLAKLRALLRLRLYAMSANTLKGWSIVQPSVAKIFPLPDRNGPLASLRGRAMQLNQGFLYIWDRFAGETLLGAAI